MKRKLLPKLSLALIMTVLLSGCGGQLPEPHDYTHTTELRQFELYEPERIRDAERSVLVTLEQLGCDDITLEGGEEVSSQPVSFQLPEGATQGPDIWYLFHLHCLVEFDEDSGGGYGAVGTSGGGGSVQFETIRVNDSPFIRIIGGTALSCDSINIEVHYYSYMGLKYVKPGEGELTFELTEYGDIKIKSATFYNDSSIEITTTPPSEYDEGLKLSPEEREQAHDIAFGDPRVQELAEGKDYAVRITMGDGMIRPVDEPPDDVEVRLVFVQNYMIEDVEAIALDVFVNLEEGVVTYIFPLGTSGMPRLTESARERAIAIALSDAGVQAALEGRGYTIGEVGPTMGGPVGRLGANVYFIFDEPFLLEPQMPGAPEMWQTGVRAVVNLQEERVVDILEETDIVFPDS